jgi:hypothetical protein
MMLDDEVSGRSGGMAELIFVCDRATERQRDRETEKAAQTQAGVLIDTYKERHGRHAPL